MTTTKDPQSGFRPSSPGLSRAKNPYLCPVRSVASVSLMEFLQNSLVFGQKNRCMLAKMLSDLCVSRPVRA